ncbi:RNA methyltransferase [bacterium]|nr:RNA methyltransferase [bacterium]
MARVRRKVREGELLYGVNSIVEALKAKRRKLISIYVAENAVKPFDRVRNHLPKHVKNVQRVPRNIIDRMTGSKEHMGVAAWFSPFQFKKNMFDPAKHPQILFLEGIQDVRNLGAILRSAHCTGITGVVLSQSNAAPLNAAAIKSSAGLCEHLDVHIAPTSASAIHNIRAAGYHLYMAMLGNHANAAEVDFCPPACLVIGNEAQGIDKNLSSSGTKITLPQINPDVSYNASVAAGILMFLMTSKSRQNTK